MGSWSRRVQLRVSQTVLSLGQWSTSVFVRLIFHSIRRHTEFHPFSGLQIQATDNKIYSGPVDAVKKIVSKHGIAGLYKGQVPTFWREAVGYGAYFWAYEKLMQREVRNGVKREDVSPVKAVLYGAAAGYAVSLRVSASPSSHLQPLYSSGRASTPST